MKLFKCVQEGLKCLHINVSYERTLSPSQSFSWNAGVFRLPTAGIYDSLNIDHAKDESGFTVSGDYRFYFKNRNMKQAPDGLFWGPYASFHNYQFENEITVMDNPALLGGLLLSGKTNIISLGVEMGYQFIIREKLSIDLVFIGPSLSTYTGSLKLAGDIQSEDYEEYLQAIRKILISRLPFLEELINEGEFNDNGLSTSVGFGFRYLVQIGYRF